MENDIKPDIVFPSGKEKTGGKKRRNTKLQQMKKMAEALQERERERGQWQVTHTNLEYNADSHSCRYTHTHREGTTGQEADNHTCYHDTNGL